MVRDFAMKARLTRDNNACAVFRNAFTTATTADGVALLSNSHTSLNGSTVDNLGSGALSETTLNTAIVQMLELKTQDDVIAGNLPSCVVVPPALYKAAVEITESELRQGTANNDANVYSDKYGVRVYTNQFLGAAAGGSDTAWFLLSANHSIYRFVRQGVQTDLVDYKTQRNNNYVYKGEFREVVGAMNYEGIVGNA